ncbi:MAG: hypothetical protein K4H23_05505 [Mollicutes bacterium PWAP]|nr:hypothetical protein [Mollicutes bacterium PWAP]
MEKEFSTSDEARQYLKFLTTFRRELLSKWSSLEFQTNKFQTISKNFKELIFNLSKSRNLIYSKTNVQDKSGSLFVIFNLTGAIDEIDKKMIEEINKIISDKKPQDKILLFDNNLSNIKNFKFNAFINKLKESVDFQFENFNFLEDTYSTTNLISNIFYEKQFSKLFFVMEGSENKNNTIQVLPYLSNKELRDQFQSEWSEKSDIREINFNIEPNVHEFSNQLDISYISMFVSLTKVYHNSLGVKKLLFLENSKVSKLKKQIEETKLEINKLITTEEFMELNNLFSKENKFKKKKLTKLEDDNEFDNTK